MFECMKLYFRFLGW